MVHAGIREGGAAERSRAGEVAGTLAAIPHRGESLGELAHDARNMVTALGLYCDLLEEPGVLATPHRHYAGELRLLADRPVHVGDRSQRLVGLVHAFHRGDQVVAQQLGVPVVEHGLGPARGVPGDLERGRGSGTS